MLHPDPILIPTHKQHPSPPTAGFILCPLLWRVSYVACLAPIIKNKTQVDSILHYVSLSIYIYKLFSAKVNSFNNTLYFALLQQTMNRLRKSLNLSEEKYLVSKAIKYSIVSQF